MSNNFKKPSREEAEEAVRTLIGWAGDDPNRPELIDTPKRVVDSYAEFFSGYNQEIDQENTKTFNNNYQYEEMIILKDVIVESHCEHHMVAINGSAMVGYIPDKKIIGLSKIARVIDCFSRRLQIQERLVVEIAEYLFKLLEPKGVGVVIESSHRCLTSRGALKPGSMMQTLHLLGNFKNFEIKNQFFNNLK